MAHLSSPLGSRSPQASALALVLCTAALSGGCIDALGGASGMHSSRHPTYGDAGAGMPPTAPPSREVCGNGVDDDGNGMVDEGCSCAAPSTRSCYTGPPGTGNTGRCHDGMQACMDLGEFSSWGPCEGSVGPTREIIENGVDDDCDGTTDEGDGICVPVDATGHEFGTQCTDSRDDDCDTLRDCADPDCHDSPSCPSTCAATETVCFGGVDDDCDGTTDCTDPDCAGAYACLPSPCPAGQTPTYRPRTLPASGGGSSVEPGDGSPNMPMTCESGSCDPGMVAVQTGDGSLICVPPPPPCPPGTNPTYASSGTWTCEPPCAYIVHYGGIYGGLSVCAGPPPPCSDGTPTFVFETATWECRPMCDGGLYDPHVVAGVLVCVPC